MKTIQDVMQLAEVVVQVLRLPRAHLEFHAHLAPQHIPATFELFTQPHPRYRYVPHKVWGAALIDLQQFADPQAYLDSMPGRQSGTGLARRARTRGYRVEPIDRNDYIDALHDINTALDMRQGRPMDPRYLEKETHYPPAPHRLAYGALRADGTLAAYAVLERLGNFHAFTRVLGYRNNDGALHLLVTDIVAGLIRERQSRFLMYDTYFGARPGLRQFKTMLGFQPYRACYSLH
jgi:hypothetical protein